MVSWISIRSASSWTFMVMPSPRDVGGCVSQPIGLAGGPLHLLFELFELGRRWCVRRVSTGDPGQQWHPMRWDQVDPVRGRGVVLERRVDLEDDRLLARGRHRPVVCIAGDAHEITCRRAERAPFDEGPDLAVDDIAQLFGGMEMW